MRLDALRERLAAEKLDGFLVTQPENRRYLSGFTGSAGVLIITERKQVLASDSRYYEQIREQCPDWELAEVGYDFPGKMSDLLIDFGLAGHRVGFEAANVTVTGLKLWNRALEGRVELVQTEDVVETLRMRKDREEIARIRKAIAVAEEGFAHVTSRLKPGMTELQVAWDLESYMRTHGAEAIPFETIVASGPNGAKPHARPSDRPIRKGESITIDWGCVVEGYCSDLTRTICLGPPADDTYMTVWNTVRKAQQAACQGARAGMTGEAVDRLARSIIEEAGHAGHFGHGLGHGVGLAVHENPRFSFTYPKEVPAGAVLTVEPGIYIPGWGGVRIEDMILMQDGAAEVLTSAPCQPVLNGA